MTLDPKPEFPMEIIHHIILHAILDRGWKRSLRLRLVDKRFAKDVDFIIFYLKFYPGDRDRTPMLFHKQPPSYAVSYFTRRVMHEPEDGWPLLTVIRRLAKDLNSDMYPEIPDNRDHLESTIQRLWSLIVAHGAFHRVFNADIIYPFHDTYLHHLAIAAMDFGSLTTLERLSTLLGRCDLRSDLLGSASLHHWRLGRIQLVELFPRVFLHNLRNLIHDACSTGDLGLFKYLYSKHVHDYGHLHGDPDPWGFEHLDEKRERTLDRWLATPNVDLFNYVMEIRHTTKAFKDPPSQLYVDHMLGRCGREGWPELASHLISLGANINNTGFTSHRGSIPLTRACSRGRIEMVKFFIDRGASLKGGVQYAAGGCHEDIVNLLLQHGAPVTGPVLVRPAERGRITLVRTLLDHGADPNEGKPHPLVSAISLEHTRMFDLLLERGANLDGEVGRECVKIAKAEGLESMLELLAEHGVDIEDTDLETMQEGMDKLAI